MVQAAARPRTAQAAANSGATANADGALANARIALVEKQSLFTLSAQ